MCKVFFLQDIQNTLRNIHSYSQLLKYRHYVHDTALNSGDVSTDNSYCSQREPPGKNISELKVSV